METGDIKQTVEFKAKPHDVYEALLDSEKYTAFSGSEAKIDRNVGGKFTTYDGYIEGRNEELVPDQKIEQSWRGDDWPPGFYSHVKFELEQTRKGTKVILTHEKVPLEFYNEINQRWIDFYWKPMKEWLEK
jgi:activator of HSP90 ATPase